MAKKNDKKELGRKHKCLAEIERSLKKYKCVLDGSAIITSRGTEIKITVVELGL